MYIDKLIYEIEKNSYISNDVIEFISTDKNRYVYGNGLQAATCLRIFDDLGITIKGLLIPPGMVCSKLDGIWGDYIKKADKYILPEIDCCEMVLLGIAREEYENSKKLLSLYNITNVFECCWEHNSEMLLLANSLRGCRDE